VIPLTLELLPNRVAVYRLPADQPVPPWAQAGEFTSVTRTAHELSVVCAEVCAEDLAPEGTKCEPGWRIFEVEGPLAFSLTGILAAIAGPLAEAGVSIFAVSTFDADYVMVKEENLPKACDALRAAGHSVRQR
jgi:hypothetical protein